MWRKNRNPANYVNCTSNPDLGNGIDLNRNFDYLWMSKYEQKKNILIVFLIDQNIYNLSTIQNY